MSNRDLFESVAATNCCPGVVLTADVVRQIWSSVCAVTETSLLSRRSTSIPDICHFVVQEELSHRGTWNVRRAYVPTVILAPSFTSISQVSSPAPASQTHVGTHATVQLNLVLVAERVNGGACTIGRHEVASVLRAIARGVAAPCVRTPARPVTLEFGFALLEFVGGKTVVRWSQQFISKFEASLGLEPAALSGVHRATSASATSSLRTTSERRTTNFAPAPPPPLLPQSARIPAPPPPVHFVPGDSGEQLLLPKYSPRRSPSASSSRSSASSTRGTSTSHRGPQHAAVPPTLDPLALLQSSSSSSPRKPQGKPAGSLPDVSPYYRHKLHKLDVRRQRKKAYLESWEQQIIAKTHQREEDKAESRRIADAFDEAVARGLEEDARKLEEQRERAKKLQDDNVTAATSHGTFLLSHQVPANDLFENRPATAHNRDMGTLASQRIERERRRQVELEDDKLLGQRLAADARAAALEATATRQKRAAASREYLEANKQLATARRENDTAFNREAKQDAKVSNASPTRFLPSDETRVLTQLNRDNLVLSQKEEIHQHRIAKTQELLDTKAATHRRANAIHNQINKTILLHEYEVELKGLQQAKNRAAWNTQIQDRSEQRSRDKAERAQRTEAIYRNESSDDEM